MRYLLVLLLVLLPVPLLAVTTFTVNSQTTGNLNTPGDWVLACDCSPSGSLVRFISVVDVNEDGLMGPGEPVIEHLSVKDNGPTDENPAAGQVTFTWRQTTGLYARVVIRAGDSQGAVEHRYLATYTVSGARLSGRCYDWSGAPKAAVPVTADVGSTRYLTYTGLDGSYSMVLPSRVVVISAAPPSSNSSWPARYRFVMRTGTNVYQVNFRELGGPYTISGRVVDSEGDPVPGCQLVTAADRITYCVTTDLEGAYSLSLPAASYFVEVCPPSGWEPAYLAGLVLPPSRVANISLPPATGYLAGQVRTPTGPVVGATVEVMAQGPYCPYGYQTVTNGRGWYQLWVPPGSYQAGAGCPGYTAPADSGWQGGPDTSQANLTLMPNAYRITGRVYRSAGIPATINVQGDPSRWWGTWDTTSDDTGSYSVTVPAGTWSLQAVGTRGESCAPRVAIVPPNCEVNLLCPVAGEAPTLESGQVEPLSGGPNTRFRYRVTYYHSDREPDEGVFVLVDGCPQPMTAASQEPVWEGRDYVCTVSGLTPGQHDFQFAACVQGMETARTRVMLGPDCGPCALDAPSLTPACGTTVTTFYASVRYQHLNNVAPVRREFIYRTNNGAWVAMRMVTFDYDYRDGSVFNWNGRLPTGQIDYYFEFDDGATVVRLPETGSFQGPTVYALPRLDQGRVLPTTGTQYTTFTASVRYQHLVNVAPTLRQFVYRVVGGTWRAVNMTTTDTYYVDGSTFTWSGHLPVGVVEYYFSFSDGATALRLPAAGAYRLTVDRVSLGRPYCSPGSGDGETEFTFAVPYTHSGGLLPQAMVCYVRPEGGSFTGYQVPTPADRDPRDGTLLQVAVSGLAEGSYEFYFACLTADGWIFSALGSGPLVGPTITIDPSSGTFGGIILFTASASDAHGIDRVEFSVDGELRDTASAEPYQWSWDTWPLTESDGAHTVRATAYDSTGQPAYAEAYITVDNATFADVPKSHPYWLFVEALYRAGVAQGCDVRVPLYCPDGGVTRGQLAVFLCRAAGWEPYYPAVPTFADVPATHSYYGYIEEIYRRGVTMGCGGTPPRFCPGTLVSRAVMALFLCRAVPIAPEVGGMQHFADVPPGSAAFPYVEGLYREGITPGCGGEPLSYYPWAMLTRAQMAAFLCLGFELETSPY